MNLNELHFPEASAGYNNILKGFLRGKRAV